LLGRCSTPLLFWVFSRWGFSNCLPGLISNSDLLISASWVARITDDSSSPQHELCFF
jgi:hypothetical protein